MIVSKLCFSGPCFSSSCSSSCFSSGCCSSCFSSGCCRSSFSSACGCTCCCITGIIFSFSFEQFFDSTDNSLVDEIAYCSNSFFAVICHFIFEFCIFGQGFCFIQVFKHINFASQQSCCRY